MSVDTLVPRRYQEDIFIQAQQRNVIAALDTGSGKTFISTLLIKWITTKPSAYNKKVVFLAPKVELAEQQALFIERNTSLRVLKLYGKTDIDLTDRDGWARKFTQHDVLVMTPQVFLNMLTHSVWKLSKVVLIVFDECHHARKNHPYNMLMREYYNLAPSKRPKIFGMTASPVWNPGQAEKSMKELEKNLDSCIVGVNQASDLDGYAPRPDEVVHIYPPAHIIPATCPVSSLYESLCVFDVLRDATFNFEWHLIERRHNITLSNLGAFAAALYLYHEIWSRIRSSILLHNSDPGQEDALPDDIYHVAEIILEYQPFFDAESDILLDWCTPKIQTLVGILLQHHSPTFQGIIFVDQRQVAACLAKILPRIPELKGLVRCANLVSSNVANEAVALESGKESNKESVEAFRNAKLNLLVATSVAEEGLDFPACDLVVRFDKLQNLVGYVQSRGRARNKASTFIVMVQSDETEYLKKFSKLVSSEPALKQLYNVRAAQRSESALDEEEDIDPADIATRERYIIPQTGAFLTYDNAISLLAHLCALVHVERSAKPPLPKYSDDFTCVLELPRSLPLDVGDRFFRGPTKISKKEAKRAVAFIAVKRLHELEVFDDHLLPLPSKKGDEDLEGRKLIKVGSIPPLMTGVLVRDPWVFDDSEEVNAWIYVIELDGKPSAGLITGTHLPPVAVKSFKTLVEVQAPIRCAFSAAQCAVMDRVTKHLIWHLNTARDIPYHLSAALYLAPLTHDLKPDFDAIEHILANPLGIEDWSGVSESHFGRYLVRNRNQHGRPYILRGIRHDLTPMTAPPQDGSRESQFPSYHAYFVDRFTRKTWKAEVPSDGPLIEVSQIPRFSSGSYPLDLSVSTSPPSYPTILLPLGCCSWFDLPEGLLQSFQVLPKLSRRITDVYRARTARFELGLPPISDELLVQALTIPNANMDFNNQRLETLGDSVLKLCTTVHLFNRYPYRHEGQLSILRQNCISNRFLMTRALEHGLEEFITGELHSLKTWRYVRDMGASTGRRVERETPRRSLQDCMEATLGAAYVTGGIPMALRTGVSLNLSLGDLAPWPERYAKQTISPVPSMFRELEELLGYKFRNGRLLVQAVTHSSFVGDREVQSYQRLEFLGDALIDLVVVDYLYKKFPEATSEKLHMPKSVVVCAPALAFVAVKNLRLHKALLMNNVELSKAIDTDVPILLNLTPEDIVNHGWKYRPPKVLSDVFESIVGAVLIDSGYDYDRSAAVVEHVMTDLLALVSPFVKLDPITSLYRWIAKSGCLLKPKFSRKLNGKAVDVGISLHEHPILVCPVQCADSSVAKSIASERALECLKDPQSNVYIGTICVCRPAELNKGECPKLPEVQAESPDSHST